MRTVRDATVEVLRQHRMTTIFGNPGSTEVPFLVDLPDDIQFVLGLHESAAVGMAVGWSLGNGVVPVVLLHTTAGFGNAVGSIATARENKAPLVVLVGQQDRRHLASEPFLTGRLERLAGDYPVWVNTPPRAADVPAAIARARHEAALRRGPAVVVVPMDDWDHPADERERLPTPDVVRHAWDVDTAGCGEIVELLDAARSPALVVGAGADTEAAWEAIELLSKGLACPVWQEPFGARAGSRQNAPEFAGHLPAGRAELRNTLERHDCVVVVGARSLRQYGYESGDLFPRSTTVVVITDDLEEATSSTANLAVLAPVAATCREVARRVRGRDRAAEVPVPAQPWPADDDPRLTAPGVFRTLRALLPEDAILVEETPSTRFALQSIVPARRPLGFLSAAMGGLGFAMPAAVGLKLALPDRPVVAVLGDGSSMYTIQALWSAQRYGAGVLFVVLSNGGYAIMDELADRAGGAPPWPGLGEVRVDELAQAQGCRSERLSTREDVESRLRELVPGLALSNVPFLLNVAVER